MSENETNENIISAIDTLFKYLEKLFYDTANAKLDIQALPPEFRDLGEGLEYLGNCLAEVRVLAKDLSAGNLNGHVPPPGNELAAPLKMLHASLRHLTWQSQQVAKGDYSQRVDFMGDFASAFNNMTGQLEKRWKTSLDEKYRLQMYVNLIMENAPDPILLIDNEKRLAYASKSYLKLFGLSGQPEGKYIHDMLSGRVPDSFLYELEEMLTAAYRESRTLKTEQFIELTAGDTRHYQIQISPMTDLSGAVEGLMIMFHDTTDLIRANEAAEKARGYAERSSRAKSDFLSRMSHEMRTPMNSILGMTAIYENEKTGEGKDYCISKINDAAKHLLGVIEDILDATNIDSEKFELYITDFNLIKMLGNTADAAKYKANERRHTLTVNIADNVPARARGDRKRLAQVISNLLSNAIKFTPSGGEITLDVSAANSAENSMLHVTVTDNGIGVEPGDAETLFTAFEQLDGGVSRRQGGIGLGLPISKHIVELMDGKIWMAPRESGGSVFGFDIPLHPPLTGEKESGGIQDEDIFSGRKILAVEDVALNAEILSVLLSSTGAEITIAADGAIAVDEFLAAPQKYDLILMDINMPNMDGYEATKRIRAANIPRASFIPIIAMTANIFKEDIERCFAAGMNAHLGKPLDVAELMDTLKDFLL